MSPSIECRSQWPHGLGRSSGATWGGGGRRAKNKQISKVMNAIFTVNDARNGVWKELVTDYFTVGIGYEIV